MQWRSIRNDEGEVVEAVVEAVAAGAVEEGVAAAEDEEVEVMQEIGDLIPALNKLLRHHKSSYTPIHNFRKWCSSTIQESPLGMFRFLYYYIGWINYFGL